MNQPAWPCACIGVAAPWLVFAAILLRPPQPVTFAETPRVVYAGDRVFCVVRGTHGSQNVQLLPVADRAECAKVRP